MKKLLVTVNGVRFDVEVEVLEDDEIQHYNMPYPSPDSIRQHDLSASHHNTLMKNYPREKAPEQPKTLTKELLSPINGVIIEVIAKPGQQVKLNEVIIVLESMKMKTNISSDRDGVIKSINVKETDKVEAGVLLCTFE